MNFVVDFHKAERERPRNRRGGRTWPRQRSQGKLGVRLGVAYFDGVRPMETGGSIVDDLIWRRTEACKPPLKNKDMKAVIEGHFAPYFVTLTHAIYSRKAGCSCGCSPGYILYGEVDTSAFVKENPGDLWTNRKKEWYFDAQEHEFRVYVATPEYVEDQKRKKVAREKEEAEKKLAAFVGSGI